MIYKGSRILPFRISEELFVRMNERIDLINAGQPATPLSRTDFIKNAISMYLVSFDTKVADAKPKRRKKS